MTMMQTEPEIEEPKTVGEPIEFEKPFANKRSPDFVLEPEPEAEELYELCLPEPSTYEELRDWQCSNLYKYVRDETIK